MTWRPFILVVAFLLVASLLFIIAGGSGASAQEYTGENFDISASGNGNSWGITTDGTHIWITDFVDAEVYRYSMDGTYIDSFDTASSGNANPAGITQDGTYFWIVDIADKEVYKYQMDGTYTGSHFDTAVCGNRQPRAITQDGTYFWITNAAYPYEVYKYSMGGTYMDKWGTVEYPAKPRNDYPWGITQAEAHIWIADAAAASVFKYSKDGTFVDHFDISVGKKRGSRGITTDGTYFWVTNTFDDVVFKSVAMSGGGDSSQTPPFFMLLIPVFYVLGLLLAPIYWINKKGVDPKSIITIVTYLVIGLAMLPIIISLIGG